MTFDFHIPPSRHGGRQWVPQENVSMNPTVKRLHDAHLQLAKRAESVGDHQLAAYHRRCALTYTFPVGALLAQAYN